MDKVMLRVWVFFLVECREGAEILSTLDVKAEGDTVSPEKKTAVKGLVIANIRK